MHAVLTGITGCRNRGVEALVVTTRDALAARAPDLALHVLTETPDYDRLRLQGLHLHDVRPLDRMLHSRVRRTLARAAPPSLLPSVLPSSRGYGEARRLLETASIVIASGGDVFSSTYGETFLHGKLRPLAIALDAGVPVVFSAHSIGPFASSPARAAFLAVASRAALVTVRERTSLAYVTRDLGLDPARVRLTSDPAFLLAASPDADRLLAHDGIDRNRPLVVFAPSQAIAGWSGADADHHERALEAAIRFALDTLGAQVLLVPHVQEIHAELLDTVIAHRLLRRLDYDPRVRLVAGDPSASELKARIAAADLVVAERMHAAIAGLSSAVPTLAIGYSIKAAGILAHALGDDDDAARDWVLSIEHFADPARDYAAATAALALAWERRRAVASRLRDALPRTRAEAERNFDDLLGATRVR